jgi:hypothetical protein
MIVQYHVFCTLYVSEMKGSKCLHFSLVSFSCNFQLKMS